MCSSDLDRVMPPAATGNRLAAMLADPRLVVIPDGPHAIIWTHAAELNRALLSFLHALLPPVHQAARNSSRAVLTSSEWVQQMLCGPPSTAISRRSLIRPMFRQNTAGFVHELPVGDLSNVDGESGCVRVQVLTNAGALDRGQQLAVVSQFTSMIADAAHDPALAECTWVLLTEAVPGGWGLGGHANTNDELIAAARKQIAKLQARAGEPAS